MSNIVQFPETLRMSDFMAEAALKQQIRQCAGCLVGVFHGNPGPDDFALAMAKWEEARTLMLAFERMQIT